MAEGGGDSPLSLSLFLCLGTHFPYTISFSSPTWEKEGLNIPLAGPACSSKPIPFPTGGPH